jgi:hypothetical protein
MTYLRMFDLIKFFKSIFQLSRGGIIEFSIFGDRINNIFVNFIEIRDKFPRTLLDFFERHIIKIAVRRRKNYYNLMMKRQRLEFRLFQELLKESCLL